MSDLITIPAEDNFETTLSQAWNGAIGDVLVDDVPTSTIASGEKSYIVVNPGQSNMQVARVSGWASTPSKKFIVDSISVDEGNATPYTQKSHSAKSIVRFSNNYQFWKDIQTAINSKTDGSDLGAFTFTGSKIQAPGNMSFKDDNNIELTLSDLASGGGADQKVAITINDTTTGTLNDKLLVDSGLTKTTNNPGGAETMTIAPDTNILATNIYVDTTINNSMLSFGKFGGNGSDGVQTDADLTITGTNGTIINKFFSSWIEGSIPRICTITPKNCITIIKIKGDANFTNWTFNFAGKGGVGGTVGNSGETSIGLISTTNGGGGGGTGTVNACGGGGAGQISNGGNGSNVGGTGGVGGTKNTDYSQLYIQTKKNIRATTGAGGGGAGGGGALGGEGGGCLIIEVGGNIIFSSTVINVSGNNGGSSINGAGGGGGGGNCIILYSGTLTGTCTPIVNGGNGGIGIGGTGGAGGTGFQLVEKNTTRA